MTLKKVGKRVVMTLSGYYTITSGSVYIPSDYRPASVVTTVVYVDGIKSAILVILTDGTFNMYESYPTTINGAIMGNATWDIA